MNRLDVIRSIQASLTLPGIAWAKSTKKRVAIIGNTGRGNYGHGLDTVWLKQPGVEIVGVADPQAHGLEKTLKKLGCSKLLGFSDYVSMLSKVNADIVSICPRYVDEHLDMALTAMQYGAKGIYMEKPFVRTPREADILINKSDQTSTKIVIAHRNRYHPVLPMVKEMIQDGVIGRVLEYRGRGKGDHRGGLLDLWVLGSHVLNLIHYFSGPPLSASATLLYDGQPVTPDHVYEGEEGLGKMAGNEVHARYLMQNGQTAYFDSIKNDGTKNKAFGFQIIGSEGVLHFHCDKTVLVHLAKGNPFEVRKTKPVWVPVTTGGVGQSELQVEEVMRSKNHLSGITDLLDCMNSGQRTLCNAEDGRIIVEMISACFASYIQQGKTVNFPLEQRGNVLDNWEN